MRLKSIFAKDVGDFEVSIEEGMLLVVGRWSLDKETHCLLLHCSRSVPKYSPLTVYDSTLRVETSRQ